MSKKVQFIEKPLPNQVDQWVKNPEQPQNETMKNFNILVQDWLMLKIKTSCAVRGVKIGEEVRELLMQKYGG